MTACLLLAGAVAWNFTVFAVKVDLMQLHNILCVM